MRRSLALLPLVAALAVAGCGGSSSSSGGSKTKSTPSSSAPKAGNAVTMKDIAFHPKTLQVKVGQKVKWTNEESVEHNVVATKGASFKSAAFGQGKSFAFTPKKAGTIDYVCTLHPGMSAKLVVK